MKKLLSLILAFAACLSASAAAYIIDGIGYNSTNSGKALAVAYDEGYHKMDTVVVPEKAMVNGEYYPVVKVDAQAFKRCDEIRCIVLPGSVTEISWDAFMGCSGLTCFPLDGITTIGNNAFEGCNGLTEITIPPSVKSMGNNVFKDCKSLDKLTYQTAKISSLPETWLSGVNLKELVIADGLEFLPENLVSGQNQLKTVEIPNSVESIRAAFNGCSGLEYIEIPPSVTYIMSAFKNCPSLKTVVMHEPLTQISRYAFSGCVSLTDIKLPGTLKNIDICAFIGCSNLTSIKLPHGIQEIMADAFSGSGLKSITLPSSVTLIEGCSLGRCASLSTVYCKHRVPLKMDTDGEANAFYDSWSGQIVYPGTLYVPHGCREAYLTADVWNDFGNIVEMPLGDINWDNQVDVLDLNMATNAILGAEALDDPEDADLNGDGKVDISDVNILIKTILGLR